jgi:hypothetical protein
MRHYNAYGGAKPRPSTIKKALTMGELLCGGTFEPMLLVCQRLGREENSAASDASSEAERLRLAEME